MMDTNLCCSLTGAQVPNLIYLPGLALSSAGTWILIAIRNCLQMWTNTSPPGILLEECWTRQEGPP
jgi:hypothetical protein